MKLRNSHLSLLPVILLMLVSCQPAQPPGPASQITVIAGATVIDGVSEAPIEDAVLVISGDTIRDIGKRGSFPIPAGARIVDAAGKVILPGMFGLHGHVGRTEGMESSEENFNRERVQRDANAYLYYGVTHLLSLGHDREPMADFLAGQRAGSAGGARLYTAGLGFGAQGGWPRNPYVNRPTTPEEARAMVQKEAAKHPRVLKIWEDNRLGELPDFSPEIYGAVIEEARRHNLRVVAHAFYLEDAKELIRRGVVALAHSVLDKEVDEEFLTLAKENRITQVTTLAGHHVNISYADGPAFLDDPGLPLLFPATVLATVGSQEYRDKLAGNPNMPRWRREYEIAAKNTAKVAAAGTPIAVGTDSGLPLRFPGLWEHREMELLVQAGLTPMEAIQAATINAARFLGVDNRYGTLAPGKVADLIVLHADPLADITNSRKIDAVWMNGKLVDRAALASGSAAPH